MKKLFIVVLCSFLCSISLKAQNSTTPLEDYVWKKGKTKEENGYVILKSGKRLDGVIVLKGSKHIVKEVLFEGNNGKEIEFPVTALKTYGLSRKQSSGQNNSSGGPINDSPESMYEWISNGTVMGKKLESTRSRDGYVILKNGTRYDGKFKLRKKEGILVSYQVKADKKYKGGIEELAHYGYNVSQEEVVQQKLTRQAGKYHPGSVNTDKGVLKGEVLKVNNLKLYTDRILFKDTSGKITEYTPKTLAGFSQVRKKETRKYTVYKNVFVEENYLGATFHVFRNPHPTSVNKFLTGLAKTSVSVGSNAAAQAIVKRDAKKNGYETNMDDLIAKSSTADLIKTRDAMVKIGGYDSEEEFLEKSDNESLKNNVEAISLAIAGREASSSMGGINNKEWIILNKKTGEEIIVYKSKFKDLIEPLLKGCYEYLSLERKQQRSYEKWSNFKETLKMLDTCY